MEGVLDSLCRRGGRPFVFAGAVRDSIRFVEQGIGDFSPRDFDIGILGIPRQGFDDVLQELGGCLNRYGGYRLTPRLSPPLDVWRLEDTWGLRVFNAPLSLASVLRSFVLDVNAIAFDLTTGLFHDYGALLAIRSKQLDFVRGALIHSPHTFAAKALLASIRFSLSQTLSLSLFVTHHLHPATLAYEAAKAFADPAKQAIATRTVTPHVLET